MDLNKTQIGGTDLPQNSSKVGDEQYNESDYVVEGVSGGEEVLKKVKKLNEAKVDEVVYGIYNNEGKGMFERLNDFLIDHSRITLKDKSYFFHMLAVMVDAGIPVVAAVKSLAVRTQNKRFSRVLQTISYNCEHGATLSQSMMRFEDVFDEAEVGIVKSGEATGRLDMMLFKLSSQLDSQHELKMKLWGAAIYPIVVLSVLVLVALGMLIWVFPTLLSLLTEGGVNAGDLPLPTRILIRLQSIVVNFWWLILLVLAGGYGLFTMYISTSYGATRWDYLKIKIPVAGGLIRQVNSLRFVSMLGLLIDSGLPVISSLKIVGNSLKNRLYKLKVQEIINNVKKGEKISESMRDSEFLFSPELTEMLHVGESSASLGKVSQKVGAQYEREIDNSLKKIASVFEPVLILFVGLFVGLLALAVMSPIYNLGSVTGGSY